MMYPLLKKDADSQILGKGGFGIVYKGKHNGEDVAIKRIELTRLEDNDKNPTEDQNMELCNHRNVLKFFAVDQDGDFK